MLKTDLHSQFCNDLLELYSKTKCSAIEDAFLRFAESEDFPQWLRSYKRNIISKVPDSSIYDALEILIELGDVQLSKDPTKVSAATLGPIISKLQSSARNMKTIPVFNEFGRLVENPKYAKMLLPFKNTISAISGWLKLPEPQGAKEIQYRKDLQNRVEKDLDIIHNMYSTQDYKEEKHVAKPSVSQQRKDMFVYLVTRFSEEIASAYENNGIPDVAKKIRSKILISNSPELKEILSNRSATLNEVNVARVMADHVWKHSDIKWSGYNHDLIEVQFLNIAGSISNEDYQMIIEEYEKNQDVMSILDNPDYVKEGIKTFDKISIDMKMNPAYLQMLVIFFRYLRNKIKI